jgi:hypothetical protein
MVLIDALNVVKQLVEGDQILWNLLDLTRSQPATHNVSLSFLLLTILTQHAAIFSTENLLLSSPPQLFCVLLLLFACWHTFFFWKFLVLSYSLSMSCSSGLWLFVLKLETGTKNRRKKDLKNKYQQLGLFCDRKLWNFLIVVSLFFHPIFCVCYCCRHKSFHNQTFTHHILHILKE